MIREIVLFAAVFAAAGPAGADVINVRMPGAHIQRDTAYRCDRCTDLQYKHAAESLGVGRHLLFDFQVNKPSVYTVETDGAGRPQAHPAPSTPAEQRRFDLSRRLWTTTGRVRFTEAELKEWLRKRSVERTAYSLVAAGALGNDLLEVLQDVLSTALIPANYPSYMKAAPCTSQADCSSIVMDKGVDRDIDIVLGDGGIASFHWPTGATPELSGIYTSAGNQLALAGPSDFTHAKVYLFGPAPTGKQAFLKYMASLGFRSSVSVDADALECVAQVDGKVCRDVPAGWARAPGIQ